MVPRLERGDTIGVVATGFAVRERELDAGCRVLQRMGYRVRRGTALLAREGYLAGDDQARAADLNACLRDSEIRAVWFARGGYGSARLLDRIDWRSQRRDPKPWIGYSDVTALFCRALRSPGQRCHYGPVVSELGDPQAWHRPSLRAALAGRSGSLRLAARQILSPGRARGTLFGGNLAVLTSLAGTRYAPDPRGKVLLLEENGEGTYRIDRMLTQLRLAGWLNDLAGVLLGHFGVPRRRHFPPDRELAVVIEEFFAPLGVPVVADLLVGHLDGKRTLPLGAEVIVDTARRSVTCNP